MHCMYIYNIYIYIFPAVYAAWKYVCWHNSVDIIKSPVGFILGTKRYSISLIRDSKTAHSLPPGHKESDNLQGGYGIVILHLRQPHSHRLSALERNDVTWLLYRYCVVLNLMKRCLHLETTRSWKWQCPLHLFERVLSQGCFISRGAE